MKFKLKQYSTDDDTKKALISAGSGAALGSLIGAVSGEKLGTSGFKKKLKKAKERRDKISLESYQKAAEEGKTAIHIRNAEKKAEKKLEDLTKLAGKKGLKKGALVGAGLGLLAGYGGYEYLKNKNRDGNN